MISSAERNGSRKSASTWETGLWADGRNLVLLLVFLISITGAAANRPNQGDIFVVVTQPVAVQAENQVLWTSTAPAAAAATTSPPAPPNFLSTDGQSWYRASFWAGKSNSVNASGFPGFDTAQGWTLDNSAYSPLGQNETNACPGVSTCNSYLDCCDNTYCVHRLVDNNLAKVCVPGIPHSTVESQGDTTVVHAGQQRRRTKQRRKVMDLTEEEQMVT